MVIVTQDAAQASVSGRSAMIAGEPDEKGKHILSIFDLQNKFIAYTAPVRTIMALVNFEDLWENDELIAITAQFLVLNVHEIND